MIHKQQQQETNRKRKRKNFRNHSIIIIINNKEQIRKSPNAAILNTKKDRQHLTVSGVIHFCTHHNNDKNNPKIKIIQTFHTIILD